MERDNMTGPNRPDRWRIDMTEQEQLRQLKEEYENMIIPETGRERLQAGIDRARMEKKRAEHARRRSAWTAVAAAANLSEDGVEAVNQDMEATVEELIRQFEDTLSEEGYHGLHVTQEVVTDNARYYTVKLSVLETEASGYEHNQFYTIDKQTGNVVTLEDLFAEGSDYISAISENIKTQMKEQMAADEGVIYFLDNDDMPEFNFQGITEQTNFYFNEKDELVIAFDEYEVAPGSMGAPEFVIPQEVTAAILK